MGELLIWYHGLVVGFDGRALGAIILLKRDCPSGVSLGCFVSQGAVGPLFIVIAGPRIAPQQARGLGRLRFA